MSTASSFWNDFKDAVRGTQQDYTEGTVGRAVLLLAVPMVLETAMESLFAIVDVFFVSRLGPAAVATVALSESMMTLVFTVGLGLSIGVTAMVARRIGEHDPDAAARTTVQAIGLGMAIAAVIAVVGSITAPQLLALMGASDDVIANSSYTRVMLGGNATVLLLFLINAAFRGAGDAAVAMRVLWLANGINIFLDPMFIFGIGPFPELGVLGAGVATNIGRGTAVVAQFWLLSRAGGRLHVRREHLQVHSLNAASAWLASDDSLDADLLHDNHPG